MVGNPGITTIFRSLNCVCDLVFKSYAFLNSVLVKNLVIDTVVFNYGFLRRFAVVGILCAKMPPCSRSELM